MNPQTQRNMTTSAQSQTDLVISQRFSQTLLLKLLQQITILYIIMTVLSAPLWVLSGINSRGRRDFIDVLLMGSSANLMDQHSKHANYYLCVCLWYDIFIQVILCLGYALLQYFAFKAKQKHKGNYIEDYSLQITNIPVISPYILIPKFEQFLMAELKKHFELIASEMELFDVVSVAGETQYMRVLLAGEQQMRVSQGLGYANVGDSAGEVWGKRQKEIEAMMKKLETSKLETDTLWVTFETRQARYLALRFLEYTDRTFMNRKLKVSKAPHPLQILWQNLPAPFLRMFFSKNLSLLICMCLLLVFDLLILYIHKSPYPLLASLVILLLEIVLKQIIIGVSRYEQHHHKSQLDVSIFSKLTKYLYINTAFIIFVSCFDWGRNGFVDAFSTREYREIGKQWFRGVGISIMLSFCLQIGYVNVRPGIQVAKARLRNWLLAKLGRLHAGSDTKQASKLKSELDICYSHLISLLMFGNTYSLTHPIFYPLTSLFCFLAYNTHRKYIAEYTELASYNNDYLNCASLQYLYASVVVHWGIVWIGVGFLPALVCAGVGALLLLFKNTLFLKLSQLGRRKFGPFCFSKFERAHASTTPLSSLLTHSQLSTHILNLHTRIRMYTSLYNHRFESEDFVQKGCVERAVRALEDKIGNLEALRMEKSGQVNGDTKKDQQIKGVISYGLTQQMLKN